jgi:hypothetical protein
MVKKFFDQKFSSHRRSGLIESFQSARSIRKGRKLRAKPMKKLAPAMVFAIVLIASPALVRTALAQTKLTPKPATARTVDSCAPIGRTANGTLVYSMKCDNLPAPPPPPQAEAAPAPPPEPEVQRTGIFGLSYTRKQPDQ